MVYARNDLVVTRRDDLEMDSVEGCGWKLRCRNHAVFLLEAFTDLTVHLNTMMRILWLN